MTTLMKKHHRRSKRESAMAHKWSIIGFGVMNYIGGMQFLERAE
jgi:hypothetical protein